MEQSRDNSSDRIPGIKEKSDCRQFFRESWPEHYRENGNSMCPFHEDGDPSLQITEKFAFCHSEGRKWDIIDLYEAANGRISKEQAINELASRCGVSPSSDAKATCCARGKPESQDNVSRVKVECLHPLAADYLQSRGIEKVHPKVRESISVESWGNGEALKFVLTDMVCKHRKGSQFINPATNAKEFEKGTRQTEASFIIPGLGPVVVVEGIVDALSVSQALPSAKVVSLLSAQSARKLQLLACGDQDIVLFLDNDKAGQEGTRKAVEALNGRCRVVDWGLCPEPCKDPNDLVKGGHSALLAHMVRHSRFPHEAAATPGSLGIFDAAQLQCEDIMTRECLVPGILPRGTTILAGSPKVGKSFLALDMALGVSTGTKVLESISVPKAEVLYLALEDNKRRLQDRIASIYPGEVWPASLRLATEWRAIDEGGLEDLERFLRANPETKLVIIDTFQKFKGRRRSSQNPYEDDYIVAGQIKSLADRMEVSVLLIHHLRKAKAASDPFEAISGSTGLTGAIDTGIVLNRAQGCHELYIRGRDVEESIIVLNRTDCGGWALAEGMNDISITEELRAVCESIREHGGEARLSDLAEKLGKSQQNVNNMLRRLIDRGLVQKQSRGIYSLSEVGVNVVRGVNGVNGVNDEVPSDSANSAPAKEKLSLAMTSEILH